MKPAALLISTLLLALAAGAPATLAGRGDTKVLCWNEDYPEPVGGGDAQVKVEPRKCGFFKRGEASNSAAVRVVDVEWKRWGKRKAAGQGTSVANMGVSSKVAIRLSDPVENCAGKRFFSKATFRYPDRTVDFKLYTCADKRRALKRDLPGSDGGPAEKGCRPVIDNRYYVGATNMACANARRVAKRGIRGSEQAPKWRCTGVGTSFGHCHGRGARSGKKAHWAAND